MLLLVLPLGMRAPHVDVGSLGVRNRPITVAASFETRASASVAIGG